MLKNFANNFLVYFPLINELELYLAYNKMDRSLINLADKGFKTLKNL